jgi:D-alanyl-D-alanine carboxypeptidase (penicillin-binding protein 5/6)
MKIFSETYSRVSVVSAVFLFLLWGQFVFGIEQPGIGSEAAVVMDAETGTVVFSKNPDKEIPPASLTKLMTMHLVLTRAEGGFIDLDRPFAPPRESWARNQPPRSSLMLLDNGQTVTMRELLMGLAIPSGNDAAVAVALEMVPSVADFVALMNAEARRLGLVKTRFTEPSGIDEDNMTTAGEFAEFCRYYINAHPYAMEEYHSVRTFAYPGAGNVAAQYRSNPGTVVKRSNNTLLGKVEGVDGLKTGYIDEAGHNIAITAERNGTRFVIVILGAGYVEGGMALWGGDKTREADAVALVEWAFSHYKTVRPIVPALAPPRVWKGKADEVPLVFSEPLDFTAEKERAQVIYWDAEIDEPLVAPLEAGMRVGEITFYDAGGGLKTVGLETAAAVEEGNILKRLWDSVRLFFN